MTLFERLQALAKKRGESVQESAEKSGLSKNLFYKWKTSEPKGADLKKVADHFDVSVDYLLGRTPTPTFTRHDELDVQKTLEEMVEGLSDKNALSYMKNGDAEISEEDAELLRSSLENAVRTSKILAKKKFTPKKYRK